MAAMFNWVVPAAILGKGIVLLPDTSYFRGSPCSQNHLYVIQP
jgi:hypothetical protein